MEKTIMVDRRQSSYGPFFTDDFGRRAFAAADNAPLIAEHIFDLVSDWRSASYVGALPASIPTSIKRFHDTFVVSGESASGILRFSDVILAKLSSEIPELVSEPSLQRKIHERLVALTSEISEAGSSTRPTLDGDSIWQNYLALLPFHWGLHGTMRLVYLAVYGAYEKLHR